MRIGKYETHSRPVGWSVPQRQTISIGSRFSGGTVLDTLATSFHRIEVCIGTAEGHRKIREELANNARKHPIIGGRTQARLSKAE
jgi:hypothetical protein